MNKDMLAKCQYHIVKIRPIARRFRHQGGDGWPTL